VSIRIGIVDDHPIFRSGITQLLERERDISVEWAIANSEELIPHLERLPVDLVLMDLELGDGADGLAATEMVRAGWPDSSVIVLSGSLDPAAPDAALAAGAIAFIAKDSPASTLLDSIRRLTRSSGSKIVSAHRLSTRERQVHSGIRRGRTNREIAAELGVSTTTINKHVQHVLEKLGARNRAEAAAVRVDSVD
jgi:two-component system response regulator DesR